MSSLSIELPTTPVDRFRIPEQMNELDGLRGAAALMVVLHHISQSFAGMPVSKLLHGWLALTYTGWIGVDIFFALSGFLITRVLLTTRKKPDFYRNFYARRVLRLAAPYFITLALVAILIPHSWAFLALSFFYLANFAQPLGIWMAYPPLWSLAVEEHFYLFWPWLVRYLRRRTLFIIAILICLLTPLFRYCSQRYGFYNSYVSWFRFDGLLWGAQLALLAGSAGITRRRLIGWSSIVLSAGGVLFVLGAITHNISQNSVLGNTFAFAFVAMISTGVIGLIASGVKSPLFALMRNPVARFLGNISYWVYLIHTLIVTAANRITAGWQPDWTNYLTRTTFVLTVCILSGFIIRHVVELPTQSLKKYFR